MAQIAMVIDLQKCTSCGACALGCKTENNTRNSNGKNSFNWADFITITEGVFPNTKFKSIPVLCNHCSNAPCVNVCPVTPKAMYKSANGITLHNDERCIGCRLCMDACPYSSKDMSADGSLYTVISYVPFDLPGDPFYLSNATAIPGCTSSGMEVATLAGNNPPDRHEYTHPDYHDVRPPNVTEKCMMCDHRLQNGEQPYCVACCPAGARVVGDIDDPNSEVSQLLATHSYFRLKNNNGDILQPGEEGTGPNVYYIRSFENNPTPVEEVNKPVAMLDFVKLYPNPASSYANIEVTVNSPDYVDCSIFNINGQLMSIPVKHEFMMAGTHSIELDLGNLNSGTYLVHVALGKLWNTRRLVVQK